MVYLTKYDCDLIADYYATLNMMDEPFPISPIGAMPEDDEVQPFVVFEHIMSEHDLINLCDMLDQKKGKVKAYKVGHGKII